MMCTPHSKWNFFFLQLLLHWQLTQQWIRWIRVCLRSPKMPLNELTHCAVRFLLWPWKWAHTLHSIINDWKLWNEYKTHVISPGMWHQFIIITIILTTTNAEKGGEEEEEEIAFQKLRSGYNCTISRIGWNQNHFQRNVFLLPFLHSVPCFTMIQYLKWKRIKWQNVLCEMWSLFADNFHVAVCLPRRLARTYRFF